MTNSQQGISAADRDLAASALTKRRAGQEPSASEQAALRRVEKSRDEQLRWEHYRSIPQKHWRAMSGRSTKVLNEQAATYGIPFGGPTIDLSKVAHALHDFLAKHATVLAAHRRGHNGKVSPDMRIKIGKANLIELRLQRERAEVIEVTRADAERMAIVRMFSDALDRVKAELGPRLPGGLAACGKIIDEYTDEVRRRLVADGGDDS